MNEETYNDEYIHDWQFLPVAGERNTYNIVTKNGCQRKFLSSGGGCSNYVDLWTHDAGTDLQRWIVEEHPEDDGVFLVRNAGKRGCANQYLSFTQNANQASLRGIDDGRTWQEFEIKSCIPEDKTPIELPQCGRLKNLHTRHSGDQWLSVNKNCNQNVPSLSTDALIDTDKFVDWLFEPVEGKLNVYNIVASQKRLDDQTNCNKMYLATPNHCGVNLILESRDQGTGAEQWKVERVEGHEDTFTIESMKQSDKCPHRYLSTHPNGAGLRLLNTRYDDQQYFKLEEGTCQWEDPNPIEISGCNTIKALGKRDQRTMLTARRSQCINWTDLRDPHEIEVNNADTEKWNFEPVEGKANTFTIKAIGRSCDAQYLSSTNGCTNGVTLWQRDSGSGKEHWTVERHPSLKGVFYLKNRGKGICRNKYFGYQEVDARPEVYPLWTHNDNNQIAIESCEAREVEKAKIPECGRIKSVGKVNDRRWLSFNDRNCNRWSWFTEHGHDRFEQRFTFKKVEGKEHTYNIISNRKGCDAVYLSAGKHCGQRWTDLAFRDDGSGLQQWVIEARDDGFTIVNAGRDTCRWVILSTYRGGGGRAHLWKTFDDKGLQLFDFEECKSDEPAPVDHSGEWFWNKPENNDKNWGPNPTEPAHEWEPNQGNNWRDHWKNRKPEWENANEEDFDEDSKFRFWIQFVRDQEYVRPEKDSAKFTTKDNPGNNEIFINDEGKGDAYEWVQFRRWKGWGAIRVAGTNNYLRPRKVDGRIRNGSPVVAAPGLNWRSIWFWNGSQFRHYSGRWMRVSDDDFLNIQRAFVCEKSTFRLVGPGEDVLDNFPGVAHVKTADLCNAAEEETDSALPADTVQKDKDFDENPTPSEPEEKEDPADAADNDDDT